MNPVVLLAFFVLAVRFGLGQEGPPAVDSRPVNVVADPAPLVKALRATLASPHQFTGTVVHWEPERRGELEGAFELIRTEKGERLVASCGRLPLVAVFDDGDRRLVHTVHHAVHDVLQSGEPTSASRFTKLLLPLWEVEAVASAAEKRTWRKEADYWGAWSYSGTLPAAMLHTGEDGVPMSDRPKVTLIDARFVVGADGRLLAAKFAVLRSDPSAKFLGMTNLAMLSSVPADPPGDTILFELALTDDPPSKRAGRLLAQFRAADAED
jgi:hypothetical protein